jgi:hypothetical protein
MKRKLISNDSSDGGSIIDSGAFEQRQVFLRVLSNDQILEIQRAAFDILQNVIDKALHTAAARC